MADGHGAYMDALGQAMLLGAFPDLCQLCEQHRNIALGGTAKAPRQAAGALRTMAMGAPAEQRSRGAPMYIASKRTGGSM